MAKTATCPICVLQDFTDNKDLQPGIHEGFTIGKGKKLYWMMVWHQSGHVTVYPRDEAGWPRWLDGGTMITIHWKPEDQQSEWP